MQKKIVLLFILLMLMLGCHIRKKEPTKVIRRDFIGYILEDKTKQVKKMLKKYNHLIDYNYPFESGRYKPLSIASWIGNNEIIKLLIDEGAEINSLDESGYYPLYLSIYSNDITTVNLLITNGADVNLKNKYGETALHHASYRGSLDMVRLLYENGAEQSYMNDGRDSVIEAIDGKNLEILKFLHEKGYNFDYLDNDGLSPLLSVIFGDNNEDILKFLIEIGVDLNLRHNDNSTVLYNDIYQNDGLYLELLLKGGADPNISPDNNFSLLHASTVNKLLNEVKLLIKYGANPSLVDDKGKTPLDYAKELPVDEVSKEIILLLEQAMK